MWHAPSACRSAVPRSSRTSSGASPPSPHGSRTSPGRPSSPTTRARPPPRPRGAGIGNEIVSLAGGTNAFADLDDTFGDVSWEKVIERKPDVILIYDYAGTTVEAKKQRLLNDPALAQVPAIKNKRFVVLPLSTAVLGVRVADATESLGRQLHPDAA